MRFISLSTMLLLIAAGCGGGPAPTPPPQDTEANATTPGPPEDVMENIEMHLWPSSDAPGKGLKPLLSIRAKRVTGSMGGEVATLAFEGAEAFVPKKTDADSEIYFEAAKGTFEEKKRAVLTGGVNAQIGNRNISLEEITWEILPAEGSTAETGMAFSDKPLKISSPTEQLEAARLRLFPDTQTMELEDVSGIINFKEVTP